MKYVKNTIKLNKPNISVQNNMKSIQNPFLHPEITYCCQLYRMFTSATLCSLLTSPGSGSEGQFYAYPSYHCRRLLRVHGLQTPDHVCDLAPSYFCCGYEYQESAEGHFHLRLLRHHVHRVVASPTKASNVNLPISVIFKALETVSP